MLLTLRRAIEWEDKRYDALDLDLEGLTGADLADVHAALRRAGHRDILAPEMDDRYISALAARSAGVPVEALGALDARDFVRLRLEVQAFFLEEG